MKDERWTQYLVATYEIGTGETLDVPVPVGPFPGPFTLDNPVFCFHPIDARMERRGFLLPLIKPSFDKIWHEKG